MKNPNVIVSSDYGSIIINRFDQFIGRDISRDGYFGIDDINIIKLLLNSQIDKFGKIAFYDVGANIGTHTLAIAKSYKEKVSIRAFEAQRQIYHMLCGTLAINGISNTKAYLNAVSDRDGEEIEINLPDYNEPNNFGGVELVPAISSDNHKMIKTSIDRIKTITLDSFDERVDFIKMDIEGMEKEGLLGSQKTIEAHRPICHIEMLKTDVDFVLSFFQSRNYIAYENSINLIYIPAEYRLNISGLKRIF